MRALAALALLAACTLHVTVEMRATPAQGSAMSEARSPWKPPQVGATSSSDCNPLAATHNIDCPAEQWAVLDPTTCTMKCTPIPDYARAIFQNYGNVGVLL